MLLSRDRSFLSADQNAFSRAASCSHVFTQNFHRLLMIYSIVLMSFSTLDRFKSFHAQIQYTRTALSRFVPEPLVELYPTQYAFIRAREQISIGVCDKLEGSTEWDTKKILLYIHVTFLTWALNHCLAQGKCDIFLQNSLLSIIVTFLTITARVSEIFFFLPFSFIRFSIGRFYAYVFSIKTAILIVKYLTWKNILY